MRVISDEEWSLIRHTVVINNRLSLQSLMRMVSDCEDRDLEFSGLFGIFWFSAFQSSNLYLRHMKPCFNIYSYQTPAYIHVFTLLFFHSGLRSCTCIDLWIACSRAHLTNTSEYKGLAVQGEKRNEKANHETWACSCRIYVLVYQLI